MPIIWFALILVVLAAIPVGSTAKPYDFRGIQLGMTLSDFLKQKHPENDGTEEGRKYYGKVKVFCSDDPNLRNLENYISLWLPEWDRKVGVKRCNWHSLSMMSKYGPTDVRAAGISVSGNFDFIQAGVGNWRLFRILLDGRPEEFPHFLKAYTRKFGKPKNKVNAPVQNAYGAKFDNWMISWSNSQSSIDIIQRLAKIDELGILYLHKKLGASYEQQLEKLQAKENKL